MAEAPKVNSRLVIDQPRWLQDSFTGRAKHFFTVTDPRNLLTSSEHLEAAKKLVEEYKLGVEPPGTTDEQVWHAKKLYASAFHPDTGEKQILIGRMSAQVPMNMTITGAMMTFYKTTPAVIFWQWINQSFMAIVNYTNRSGDQPIPTKMLGQAYFSATGAALVVALGLNSIIKSLPPLIGRYVPFAAVAAANCVNIPLMRQRELLHGIPVFDENGKKMGDPKIAARHAVAMTVVSRIAMASPCMGIPPIIMAQLERKAFMKEKGTSQDVDVKNQRMPWLAGPIQICLLLPLVSFAVPLCCAIFPQISSIATSKLEPEIQELIKKNDNTLEYVYFNKGL